MFIKKVEISDFDEDLTTVSVTSQSFEGERIFNIQTMDGECRRSLGCCITTDDTYVDIDYDDYPLYDIEEIVDAAEAYIQHLTKEKPTEYSMVGCDIYLIVLLNRVTLAIKNPDFINADTSRYQRKYIPIYYIDDKEKVFDNEEEAIKWLSLKYTTK